MSPESLKRRKRFGQIFLINPEIAQFEVSKIPTDSKTVLEIGSGPGFLTDLILKAGFRLIAIEPDHVYADILRTRFAAEASSGNIQIVQKSFLEYEPGEFDCIIGNIPYFLSSEIIFRLFDHQFKKAILMVQKEFAEKVCATPGTRGAGRISYSIRLKGDVSYLRTVPRVFFDPRPEVDSAIFEVIPSHKYDEVPKCAEEVLLKIFSARRKKLSTLFKDIPEKYGDRRGESLSMEEFLNLCSYLSSSFPDPLKQP